MVSFADTYEVTIVYQIKHRYYNTETHEETFTDVGMKEEVIQEEANTPDEAESKAKETCRSICSSLIDKQIGTKNIKWSYIQNL